MASHLNRTIYTYTSSSSPSSLSKRTPDSPSTTRKYLLDVNPYARQRHRGDGMNIIDARWIDTRNGLYIDITGLSELNPESEPLEFRFCVCSSLDDPSRLDPNPKPETLRA